MNKLEQFLHDRAARKGDFLKADRGCWVVSEVARLSPHMYWLFPIAHSISRSGYAGLETDLFGAPIALYRPDWDNGFYEKNILGEINPRLFFTKLEPKEQGYDCKINVPELDGAMGIGRIEINGIKFVRA